MSSGLPMGAEGAIHPGGTLRGAANRGKRKKKTEKKGRKKKKIWEKHIISFKL